MMSWKNGMSIMGLPKEKKMIDKLYFEELETAEEMEWYHWVGLGVAGAAGVGVGYYVAGIVAAAVT